MQKLLEAALQIGEGHLDNYLRVRVMAERVLAQLRRGRSREAERLLLELLECKDT